MSRHHPFWVLAVFSFKEETLWEWNFTDPRTVDPDQFDLCEIFACRVKKNRGTETVRSVNSKGWSLFADLVDSCPVTGKRLHESTWYLFAAQGLA